MKITIEWMELEKNDSYTFPMDFKTYKDFNAFIVESLGLHSRLGSNKVKFHIKNGEMSYSGRLDYGGSMNGLYILEKWIFDFIHYHLEEHLISPEEYKKSLEGLELNDKEWLKDYKENEAPKYDYDSNTKESCYICGKDHSLTHYKTKGLYSGNYGYDEPFPHSYTRYCETCNGKYRALKDVGRKELLSKIRSAIKRDCKTLSIRKGKTYVFDIEISPLIKDHNYRCFNDEELAVLVEWKIFDSMETKTNLATIKDMYYFYLTRKDLIEPKKRAIAKGKISPVDNITIQTNELKQGIEVVFPNKPERSVLTKLKELGFRWNNRNNLWYIKQSNLTIEGENFIKSLT